MRLKYPNYLADVNGFILSEINRRFDAIKDKKKKIDELELECDLIKDNIIEIIRNDLNNSSLNMFYGFNSNLLRNAFIYNYHKDDKDGYDEKALKEMRDNFNFVTNRIKEILFPDYDFKLVNIFDYCYTAAYEFHYEYKDRFYIIRIPVFAGANEKNCDIILNGYAFGIEEGVTQHILICDLDAEKIKNKINEEVGKL